MPIPGPPITSSSIVRFVDSIAASPTTRLDINDGASFVTLRDGTAFNPPPLNQPTSAMPGIFDGAPPSASSYGNRVVDLKLRLKGTDEDGLANLVRALMVELNRDTNILMLQVGSAPVFFRTYRTSAEDVDFGDLGLGECTVTVPVLAEPFAYGLRVDQAGVSVKADPSLTNGCYLDVNGVTGDVATPALIALSAGTVASNFSFSYLSVRRHGAPASFPFVFQAEAATMGTDTAVTGSNDVAASGAGNNTTTTTFATATTLAIRLSINVAATNQTEIRGTYRVLARVRKSVGTDTITMSAFLANGALGITALAAGTNYQIVDLGLLQIPPGEDSPIGYSGSKPNLVSSGNGATLSVQAGRSAGSGTLKIDYLLLVPADEELCIFNPAATWSIVSFNLDGPNDACYWLTSGAATPGGGMTRAGAIPKLQPGNNRLFFVENITTAAVGDSSTVTVSYWPRHLVV